MNKRKIALFSVIGVVVIIVIIIALYINSIGLGNLKLMYTLKTTDKAIVRMEESSGGNGYYLTKMTPPTEIIRERMGKAGWTYVEQEGSGHFFIKDNRRVIVTTKIWNGNFIQIIVQNDAVNLADENLANGS